MLYSASESPLDHNHSGQLRAVTRHHAFCCLHSMSPQQCPLCDTKSGVKHTCEACNKQFCRSCCYHYLALAKDPTKQVRTCNECFLQHVAWDSTRTHDVFGPAEGRPVVLVHGALIGRQCMVLEAKALAEAGYRVIVPDLPAHGARFKEQPLTLGNAVSSLYQVIEQEVPAGKKVVIMGFSMGGYVAAAFAAAHPEMCAGVLMGACCHDCHTFKWKMVGYLAEAVYAVCSDKTKSEFIYKSSHGGVNVMDPARPEIQECFMRAGTEMDAWKYTWRVMHDADMRKLLPKITCPALLVVGESDYRSHEKEWLSLLQHGRLLVLKGGIHAFMVQPGVVDDFRREAFKFTAAAAAWDGTSLDAAAAAATGAAGATGPAGSGEAGSGELAAAGAEPLELAPPKAVGVGVVLENVLAQFTAPRKPEAHAKP